MRYSDFTNVVATGLRPVGLGAAFHTKEDGPQGRGYSGYSFLLASISSATEELPGWELSPEPLAQVWERAWHPAVPLQKSESNWRRGLD
jgi:hypothetical protein